MARKRYDEEIDKKIDSAFEKIKQIVESHGIFSFEIPFRLPSLNEYVDDCRTNRYGGAKSKRATETKIVMVLPKVIIDGPVWFDFVWYEKTKRRDKDNVAFAKKYILDAIQRSGMLPNDNNQFVLGFSDRFVYGEGDKVKVIVRMGGKNDGK